MNFILKIYQIYVIMIPDATFNMRRCEMSFKNLNIQSEYRSFEDNIVDSFYLPILKESVQYDRAVGFFSSTVLIEMMKGLKGLIRNEGKMRLIISPKLSEEDIEAILAGYEQRSDFVEKAMDGRYHAIVFRDVTASKFRCTGSSGAKDFG